MSYVLEALKKAEAERRRGELPGLQAVAAADQPPSPAGRSAGPMAWAGAGLVVVGVAAATAWWVTATVGSDRTQASAARDTAVTPAPIPAAVQPAAAPRTPPTAAVAEVAPVAATPKPPREPAPAVAARAAERAPAASVARPAADRPRPDPGPRGVAAADGPVATAAPARTPSSPRTAPEPALREPPVAAVVAPAPAAVAAKIPLLAELPPERRRQIPPLVVSGSVHSDVPSGRFVILNGQLLHEGEPVGNELVLEQIALKSAVLRTRDGVRFRISF